MNSQVRNCLNTVTFTRGKIALYAELMKTVIYNIGSNERLKISNGVLEGLKNIVSLTSKLPKWGLIGKIS